MKQTALTKFGATFLLVYALLVQQPQTGFNFSLNSNLVSTPKNDLSIAQIYAPRPVATLEATDEPEPTQTPAPQVASITIKKIEPDAVSIIKKYASENNLDENIMIKIAECESGFNPSAVNGQYAGIYQFHPSTWESNRKAMGESSDTSLRFNLEEAVKTAAFKMARDGYGAWPACQSYAQESLAQI